MNKIQNFENISKISLKKKKNEKKNCYVPWCF